MFSRNMAGLRGCKCELFENFIVVQKGVSKYLAVLFALGIKRFDKTTIIMYYPFTCSYGKRWCDWVILRFFHN